MSENIVRREIQRRNDPFGIPACFYWTIDEVADWVESIGYGKYKENFRSHFVNGRKLLTVDACVLPKMGITHFGDTLTLSKLIRDQLCIRNDLRDFKMYGLRKHFISHSLPCGKLHANISYKRHIHQSEQIINARLAFFRKRSIYYSGWSMEAWWDEKLRAEEKEQREKQKQLGDEDKRVVIGNTQQERLQEAAKREISFKQFNPKWPKRMCKKLVKYPAVLPILPEEHSASASIVGYLNMMPVNLKSNDKDQTVKEKKAPTIERPKPYLPIKLHWKPMDKTVGYPQLKVTPSMIKCGYYIK